MAARTKLEPGEHSIERAKVREGKRPSGAKFKRLTWSIRLHGAAEPVRKHTEAEGTATDAAVRRKALAQAEEMLRTNAARVAWKQGDSFARFIEAEVRPRIEGARNISDTSRTAYLDALGFMLGSCEGHAHSSSLAGLTVFDGTGLDELTDCLQEVSRLHGYETARRCRTVLTGHVMPRLIAKRLITASPLAGVRIDLTSMAKQKKQGRKGGVALSLAEFNAVYAHLVGIDPAEGAVEPSRGRWKLDHVIARRRNAIELTLLQMATGLRLSEARRAWVGLFEVTAEGVAIHVDASIAKGGVPRVAHVLDPRVAERVKTRLRAARSPEELYAGAPSNAQKAWTLRDANDKLAELYLEMRTALGIDAFETERSHVWRATLNTMMETTLTAAQRAAQFGHSEKIGNQHYLDDALDAQQVRRAQLVLAS